MDSQKGFPEGVPRRDSTFIIMLTTGDLSFPTIIVCNFCPALIQWNWRKTDTIRTKINI